MLKLFDPILTDLSAEPLSLAPRRYGLVAACDGGLLEVSGLAVPVGSLCSVAHGRAMTLSAEVIGFRNGRTLMMLLGDSVMLRPGARVCPVGRPGLMAVGAAFLGRAIDGEGLPIDGGGPIHARGEWPSGGIRTSALDRSPVVETFDTGVRALNALTTFGIGQRIGVMAGSGVGKSVLLDMIAHGASAALVIVGLIGERAREVSDFVQKHMAGEKRDRTVVVAVPAAATTTVPPPPVVNFPKLRAAPELCFSLMGAMTVAVAVPLDVEVLPGAAQAGVANRTNASEQIVRFFMRPPWLIRLLFRSPPLGLLVKETG